jgi:hypothetical protein
MALRAARQAIKNHMVKAHTTYLRSQNNWAGNKTSSITGRQLPLTDRSQERSLRDRLNEIAKDTNTPIQATLTDILIERTVYRLTGATSAGHSVR